MIPEGYNAQQIGQLLEENLVCRADDFEKYYRSKLEKYDFEEQITVTENRFYALEGYLFPDTYEFYVIDDLPDKPSMDTSQYAKQAAEKMYSNFQNKITKKMYARAKEARNDIRRGCDPCFHYPEGGYKRGKYGEHLICIPQSS